MKNVMILLGMAFLMMSKASAQTAPGIKKERFTLYIAPYRVACEGPYGKTCLQIRRKTTDPWMDYHGPIKGLRYRPGYEYRIIAEGILSNDPLLDLPAPNFYVFKKLIYKRKKAASPAVRPAASFQGTTWIATEINGQAMGSGSRVFFIYNAATRSVSGNGGCNTFSGDCRVEGESLTIGPLVSTKMACNNLSLENSYFKALQSATRYTLAGDKLILFAADNVVGVFQRG